jgi:uncharacterized membrane protein (DUF2068 family)
MISAKASKTVVRSVAVFEAAKGAVVLLAGFGVLSLVHHDVRVAAAALVGRLHLNPTHRFEHSFIEAASGVTDTALWLIASLGFLYALFRFLEAYGLWSGRRWAEWLAVVSGGLYLPLEIYELIQRYTWVRVSALVVNLIVVFVMTTVLARDIKQKSHAEAVRKARELA